MQTSHESAFSIGIQQGTDGNVVLGYMSQPTIMIKKVKAKPFAKELSDIVETAASPVQVKAMVEAKILEERNERELHELGIDTKTLQTRAVQTQPPSMLTWSILAFRVLALIVVFLAFGLVLAGELAYIFFVVAGLVGYWGFNKAILKSKELNHE